MSRRLTVIWIHTAARKIEKMKTGIRWILRAVNEGWGRRKMRPPSIIALKTESIAHHENSSIESGLTEDAPCVEVQSAALGESSAIRTKVGGRVCSTSFLRMARNPFPIRFLGESSGIESNAMPLAPGEQLGHYKIQSPIGRGGMGEACITIRAQIC